MERDREREREIEIGVLSDAFSAARDEVTQNARVDHSARPGLAMEVHFSAALKIPDEEGNKIPLYRAVETTLKRSELLPLKFVEARTQLHTWIDAYADEDKKALYHQTVNKGYGTGDMSELSYNQEITPLIGPVASYMGTLPPKVCNAWLLPALEHCATAYDSGDPVSCAKGIQERLTVLDLNVEGIDSQLRSLSAFAEKYMYVTDPNTHGADRVVKDAVAHMTDEERARLLQAEKPTQDAFNAMFMEAVPRMLIQAGLLPLHVDVLMHDPQVQKSLNASLELHYDPDYAHYAALIEQVREKERSLETPEQRRDRLAAAAEARRG